VDRNEPPAASSGALGAGLTALYDLYRHRDAGTFPGVVATVVARLIACDSAAYVRTEPGSSAFAVASWPEGVFASLDHRETAALHAQDHPLVANYRRARNARAWSLYDFVTQAQFKRTALYKKLYAPLHIGYQLVMLLPSPGAGVDAVALNRAQEDFSDDDRHALELLWPHLTQAARNLRVLSRVRDRSAVSSLMEGRGVIVLDSEGGIELCTEQARVWLLSYCPEGYPRRKIELPQKVAEWTRAQLVDAKERGLPARQEPLILTQADRFLLIRLIVDHGRAQHLMLLEEESLRAPAAALQGLGLTEREAEVLAWVAQGKGNREIGMILGMSARTVQKHLEHVFEKLEVESRTAAILRAWQVGRYFSLGPR
jgi:DNA-binding CsgD family transcriptional regulator